VRLTAVEADNQKRERGVKKNSISEKKTQGFRPNPTIYSR